MYVTVEEMDGFSAKGVTENVNKSKKN